MKRHILKSKSSYGISEKEFEEIHAEAIRHGTTVIDLCITFGLMLIFVIPLGFLFPDKGAPHVHEPSIVDLTIAFFLIWPPYFAWRISKIRSWIIYNPDYIERQEKD